MLSYQRRMPVFGTASRKLKQFLTPRTVLVGYKIGWNASAACTTWLKNPLFPLNTPTRLTPTPPSRNYHQKHYHPLQPARPIKNLPRTTPKPTSNAYATTLTANDFLLGVVGLKGLGWVCIWRCVRRWGRGMLRCWRRCVVMKGWLNYSNLSRKGIQKVYTIGESIQWYVQTLSHSISKPNPITRWCFSQEPCKIVSLRASHAYASSSLPKGRNRLLVNALIKFDTTQVIS